MSSTSTPARDRVAKTAEVTPGRSLPVSVMSSVSGRGPRWSFIADPTLAVASRLSVVVSTVVDRPTRDPTVTAPCRGHGTVPM